ncbi:MAG TPA: hypothetical protein VKN76_11195 [Kiloniellaceae bacterium]|nr:hypothetical protein [Kiloniellaceae bacterium]
MRLQVGAMASRALEVIGPTTAITSSRWMTLVVRSTEVLGSVLLSS